MEGDFGVKRNIVKVRISIHALRVEGDYFRKKKPALPKSFLSTPSGWRATARDGKSDRRFRYFYPRPPGGGRRRRAVCDRPGNRNFYPRPPGGGRPEIFGPVLGNVLFLSTPSGWRATRHFEVALVSVVNFYPRPPGGGRRTNAQHQLRRLHFYPRPPGGGRAKTDKVFVCFCAKGRRICLFKTRKEKNLPVAF